MSLDVWLRLVAELAGLHNLEVFAIRCRRRIVSRPRGFIDWYL